VLSPSLEQSKKFSEVYTIGINRILYDNPFMKEFIFNRNSGKLLARTTSKIKLEIKKT